MRCKSCLLELQADAFYASNKARCKACVIAGVKQNRLAKIDHYRAFDRARASLPHRVQARAEYRGTDAYRISHAVASKRWEVANALRKRAIQAVNNALRDGRLDRQPCFLCGSKAQAHHPDYSAPLAVAWLCPTHHAQTHKEHRQWLREEPCNATNT